MRDQATGDSTRQDYTYDVFGNMTEVKTWPVGGGSQTTTIAVNANTNRLSVAGYDASGNMTSWGSDAYSYDTSNSMTEQNGRWLFLYNFSGERVATIDWQGSIATREVDWTIRGPGNQVLSTFKLVGEDQSGNWTHEMDYIWMGRRLLGTEDGSGTKKHYHTDHLGSIRLVTDSLGAKISEHEYLPYGEELTAAGNGVMKFTGHERDADTGMDYMHARFYTSHLGRFMGVDPVMQGAGIWNRYSYVGGNPINAWDPDGRKRAKHKIIGMYCSAIQGGSQCEGVISKNCDNTGCEVTTVSGSTHWVPAANLLNGFDTTAYGKKDPIRTGTETIRDVLDWALGNSPQADNASEEQTRELSESAAATDLLEKFRENQCVNSTDRRGGSRRYGGDFSLDEYFTTFSVTGHAVGGFAAHITDIGDGQILVSAQNTWGLESATRNWMPGTRHNSSVQEMLFDGGDIENPKSLLENRTGRGAMANVTYHYNWVQDSPCGQ